ncbi:MAG: lytic transglycosylase domain-containing protein [Ferruginibacter sp.]
MIKELRTTFVKIFGISIFFTICINHAVANNRENPTDSIPKTLVASLDKRGEAVIVLKQANIVYPDILSGNEAASIDYVEKFSTKRKEYLVRTYIRSKELFPKAEAILKKYDVPQEFKVLLALESGFNGNAVSSAGAVGYWQIMDEVAKEYGLKIPRKVKVEVKSKTKSKHILRKSITKKIGVDERKNFIKSTNVAARYLKDRSRNLDNDWLLIAASYNCGVGNVWNAMQRSGKKSPTFWDIQKYLPAETKAYVMNFITLNVIFNNYDAFTKNELCFKDITCKVETIEEEPVDNATTYMVE